MNETRTEYTVEEARAAGLLPVKGQGKSKYLNKKMPCANGHLHASGIEAKRCNELYLMHRAEAIFALTVQPRFLIATGYDDHGKRVRASYYQGDFFYIERGDPDRAICEDVKAVDRKTGKPLTTALFRYKWKEAKRLHPSIEFRIVEG